MPRTSIEMVGAFPAASRAVTGEFLGKSAAPTASVLDRITVVAARPDATVVVVQAHFTPAPWLAAMVRQPLDVMATEVDTARADPTIPYARVQIGIDVTAQKGALLDVHA